MNKSVSKYFNTSLLMNQALIELLNKKDYEFITIKEICDKAGVNRSTFYLHYETIDDLLEECIENTNKNFLNYFSETPSEFIEKLKYNDKDDLILITHKYLEPYLNYVRDNKVLYQVTAKNPYLLNSISKYNKLNNHIFMPIFKKFGIDEKSETYMIAYYINGVFAIINEWIKNNCKDDIEYIEDIIMSCVRPK